MDPNYIQELHNLLVQSTADDTVQLKAATAQLDREFYKYPACIPALANIIASSPEIAIRQLAGVEMLKRVSQDGDDLWTQVPEADREQIKADLPKLVLNESNALVRYTTAHVIAAIAGMEVPMQTWDQLIPFLEETCISPQASHREAGLYMLVTLLEDVVEGFQSSLPRLLQLFDSLLRDPESNRLRVTTDRALDTIVENIDVDEIKAFQLVLPGMVHVVRQTLEFGDDASAQPLFDFFETLLILEKPLLSLHIPQFAQFLPHVIAAIANMEVPAQSWDQLVPFLEETCVSSQAYHREVGVYILFTFLEYIAEDFEDRLPSLIPLFDILLRDPESNMVRVTTVRALGTVAGHIDANDKSMVEAFQLLLPGMVEAVQQTLDLGDDANAKHLFGVFKTLLIFEKPLLRLHIPQLTQFLLQCGANRGYDDELRVLALDGLRWTVWQYGTSEIQANNLTATILEGLMPITTEPEPEDADHAIDAPSISTLHIIDALSTTLPPSEVFPPLRTILQEYFASPDDDHRRGAMLALGISVEGSSEFMTPLMDQMWPIIDAGLQDPDAGVRKASCVTVSRLCWVLEDECRTHHAALIPAIVTLVSDPATQLSAVTALDGLLKILENPIGQYLQLVMEHLPGLLETAPLPVKTVVIDAIGSVAEASKERFLPYFAPTMERLMPLLVLTSGGEGEEQELHGRTMWAVGTFAEVVGKEVFRPYYTDIMRQAFRDIETYSAFHLLGVMARVFGEEFGPSLSACVPDLINCCKPEESGEEPAVRFAVSDAEVAAAFASGSCPSNAIAADTIDPLFAATGADFLQSVEPCTNEQVPLLPHFYEVPGAPEFVLGLGRG